ncbi:Anaphase-promoting complex subunit, partial [Thalictrum thalictroides]
EVVSIPLPRTVTSIWPLPCGLLLQKAGDGHHSASVPYPASSILNARDLPRPKRELGYSPQQNLNVLSLSDHAGKGDLTRLYSHLILKDLLEEPQAIYVEEKGQLCPMKDFDERTIWTSNLLPLMASYNKGKMQHSLWLIEKSNSTFEFSNANSHEAVPPGVLPKQSSLRRIWQGKGAPSAASKVPVLFTHVKDLFF